VRCSTSPGFLQFSHDILISPNSSPDCWKTDPRAQASHGIARDKVLLDHGGKHGLRASAETILFAD